MPSESITTANAGRVSRPENGGAKKAAKEKINTLTPKSPNANLLPSRLSSLGRENFSSFLMYFIRVGKTLFSMTEPKERFFQRSGSHRVLRPTITCRATSMAIISKMCVSPPVGTGKAGIASRITNKTPKLFSAKTPSKPCRVLGLLLFSQASSSTLKGIEEVVLGFGIQTNHTKKASNALHSYYLSRAI